MDSSTSLPPPSREKKEHKRSHSEAVSTFKSLVASSRTRSPAKPTSPQRKRVGQDTSPQKLHDNVASHGPLHTPMMLPTDHPHAPFQVLGDVHNRGMPSPQRADKASVKHKKSMSEMIARLSPKKSPRKQSVVDEPADKENTTPPGSAGSMTQPPIWSQFATRMHDDMSPSKYPRRPLPGRTESEVLRAPASPSKVQATVAMYNKNDNNTAAQDINPRKPSLQGADLDVAFEAVLAARDVPENMRPSMRALDDHVKREFIKNNTNKSPSTEQTGFVKSSFWSRSRAKSSTRGRDTERTPQEEVATPSSPSKRGRSHSRGRLFTLGKGDKSPFKRPRSTSRPRSIMSLKNFSSSSVNSIGLDGPKESKEQQAAAVPDDFIRYLEASQEPQTVEIGRVHKLRLLVRNESISWTDTFMIRGGMSALIGLLDRIMQVEWREEHEDMLLHEVLLCLKGLCTTQRAQEELAIAAPTLFPSLLKMIFDDERKGPSEFTTRGIIFHLLFTHLSSSTSASREARTQEVLSYLSNPDSPDDDKPVGFIAQMQQRRPYQLWHKEVSNVTKEVFWIFLHHLNVIPQAPVPATVESNGGSSFFRQHFPRERPPVPAAPYVGGVEWEATNYISQHFDLMNGLIATLSSQRARNQLRDDLRASGFEKLMGGTLRLCKEKFYGAVHDVLRTWVGAATDDGWEVRNVRMGPPREEQSPAKRKTDAPPKLELPKLTLGGAKVTTTDWL